MIRKRVFAMTALLAGAIGCPLAMNDDYVIHDGLVPSPEPPGSTADELDAGPPIADVSADGMRGPMGRPAEPDAAQSPSEAGLDVRADAALCSECERRKCGSDDELCADAACKGRGCHLP
ncbi:MAG TPA: hypothetical protein VF881_17430 [Polyangiaceae bacterium]